MTPRAKSVFVGGLVVMLFLLVSACSQDPDGSSNDERPLQPLIYTEYPDLTPEGAAVREHRLARQFLGLSHGQDELLEEGPEEPLPPLSEPQELGQAIVRALVGRQDALFEHTFVSPSAYAALVHVNLSEAAEFVDNQIGRSLPLWELFSRTHSSEMSAGGFSELLEFEEIELGRGRTIDGGIAREGQEIVQYWGNRVVVAHVDSQVRFELRIPRIFRVPQANIDDEVSYAFYVASEIEADLGLRTFFEAGLHLKPQLMRPQEYPFPLEVGNFWRYLRYDAQRGVVDEDPLDRRIDEVREGLAATEVIIEVRQVSQYGPIRLVHLMKSYDDSRYTRVQEWWIATPRRIYACTQNCRNNVENLQWLIDYFQNQAPIFKFPLRLGDGWSSGGRPAEENPIFVVEEDWQQVETPAGVFPGSFRISGRGPLGTWDRYLNDADVVRIFAPGRGVVRRELRTTEANGNAIDVVEELVEYRIIP